MKKPFKISDLIALKSLLSYRKKHQTIKLQLSALNEDENQAWQNRIEKQYHACGCEVGSAFVFSSIIISLIYAMINYTTIFSSPWQLAGYFFGFVFIMGGIGKIIGLIYARIKLKQLIDELNALCIWKHKSNVFVAN